MSGRELSLSNLTLVSLGTDGGISKRLLSHFNTPKINRTLRKVTPSNYSITLLRSWKTKGMVVLSVLDNLYQYLTTDKSTRLAKLKLLSLSGTFSLLNECYNTRTHCSKLPLFQCKRIGVKVIVKISLRVSVYSQCSNRWHPLTSPKSKEEKNQYMLWTVKISRVRPTVGDEIPQVYIIKISRVIMRVHP